MSQEVLEIIKQNTRKSLQMQVALQCAPLLAGVKMSNLVIVHKDTAEYVRELFAETELRIYELTQSKEKVTFLLYDEACLKQYIAETETARVMQALGYETMELEEILPIVAWNYTSYMRRKGEFPHELGLLLGYPAKDVEGFIVNKGENYLYSGYWKVYGNVKEALKTFEQYTLAKENVIKKIAIGMGILEIFEYYRKRTAQMAV